MSRARKKRGMRTVRVHVCVRAFLRGRECASACVRACVRACACVRLCVRLRRPGRVCVRSCARSCAHATHEYPMHRLTGCVWAVGGEGRRAVRERQRAHAGLGREAEAKRGRDPGGAREGVGCVRASERACVRVRVRVLVRGRSRVRVRMCVRVRVGLGEGNHLEREEQLGVDAGGRVYWRDEDSPRERLGEQRLRVEEAELVDAVVDVGVGRVRRVPRPAAVRRRRGRQPTVASHHP
eukprot:3910902-Pleurochrysis_carterae.AAC.1